MYLPAHFAETRPEVLLDLMRAHPLATIVTHGPDGLAADPVPLIHSAGPLPHGVLRGHVARANSLWKKAGNGVEALVLFQGPDAYVSPNWYPAKQEHHKAVPTWNYVTVQVRGRLRALDDRAWLRELLAELTATHEAGLPRPWRLEEAPPDYLDRMLAAIVGIQIDITDIVGKWKLSQNQPPANRAGVVAGLEAGDSPAGLEVAASMRRRQAED